MVARDAPLTEGARRELEDSTVCVKGLAEVLVHVHVLVHIVAEDFDGQRENARAERTGSGKSWKQRLEGKDVFVTVGVVLYEHCRVCGVLAQNGKAQGGRILCPQQNHQL